MIIKIIINNIKIIIIVIFIIIIIIIIIIMIFNIIIIIIHIFINIITRVDFFEIRRYFCKITGNSADTAAIILRFADAPLS